MRSANNYNKSIDKKMTKQQKNKHFKYFFLTRKRFWSRLEHSLFTEKDVYVQLQFFQHQQLIVEYN